MVRYAVAYRPEVDGDLDLIPKNIQARIKRAIEERLCVAPDRYGQRLRRSLTGLWKLRVGDNRIVYEIKGGTVTVWCIVHRKSVYRETQRRWQGPI